MIIYNVTTKVSWSISEAWLKWLKDEHIPDILATNCFNSFSVLKILHEDDVDGPTYVAQYFTDSIEFYRKYLDAYAPAMRQKAFEKWADGFVSIRTVMEVVH